MNEPPRRDSSGGGSGATLAAHAMKAQIMTAAILLGLVVIAVILWTMLGDDGAPRDEAAPAAGIDYVLFGVALVVSVGAWIAAVIVPPLVNRLTRARVHSPGTRLTIPADDKTALSGRADELVARSLMASIVGQAVLEGASVTVLILMFLDGHPIYLALVAVSIIGIVLLMPTASKLRMMLENLVHQVT